MESEEILSEPKDESIQSKNDDTDDYFSKKIKELNALLDEEIAKAEKPNMEDFDDPEIKEQNKQIEKLKKQIEANKIDIDKDYNIVCQEQLKLFNNFQKDLEEKFNSYEKLVIDEINDLKENLNKQTNKQFDNFIKDIKGMINGDIKNQNDIQKLNDENENENNCLNKKKENTNNTHNNDKEIKREIIYKENPSDSHDKGFITNDINKSNPNDNSYNGFNNSNNNINIDNPDDSDYKGSNNINIDNPDDSDYKGSNNININTDNPNDSDYKEINIINMNKDKLNNINYSDKEFNKKNKDNNDFTTSNNIRISNKIVKRKSYNNNAYNVNQNNGLKNENINPEAPFIKMNKNLVEHNINTSINEGKNEINTNNFRKNNNNNFNFVGNNQNNIKIFDYRNKPKDGALKLKSNNIKVNDRKDEPKITKNTNDDQSQKYYQNINSIFFLDYQQKWINDTKISDYKKEELQKEIFNDKIKGRNILKNYYMNFIEANILPLFKKNKNIIRSKLEIIKYNISVILECLGMDKNYYNNYYYQYETNNQKISRPQSQEAVLRFRKEFGIKKEDIKDEALEKKLIENNLDIFKTFGKMFG